MARRGSSGMTMDSVNAKESIGPGFNSQPKQQRHTRDWSFSQD
jgi:hypothetical protein